MDQDATWNGGIGLSPGRIVLDGDLAPQKGAQQPPLFRRMSMAKRLPISAAAKLLCKVTTDGIFDHATYHSRQKRAKTLRHMGRDSSALGQDSSALRSELSLGHFGTSADPSGQFGPTKPVPKCPGTEVSWVRSVRNSSNVQRLSC